MPRNIGLFQGLAASRSTCRRAPGGLANTKDDMELKAGDEIKNRYRIEKELGRGGIGIVYLARDKQLHLQPVIIKTLREDVYKPQGNRGDEWIKRKFLQEAEALSRVNHPNVVKVLGRDELPDGRPFLVMEYVEGRSLRDAMKRDGMDFEQVAQIVRQIGQGLTAVHKQSVYHRDLKPENVMLQNLGDGEEQAKLIDFGIARVKDSDIAPETETPMIVGTLPYLAPEQIHGQPITAATDTFALGVIAYEMLTGRLPFRPTSRDTRMALNEIAGLQQAGLQLKPRQLRAELPEAAEDAILRVLSLQPEQRHERARDFGDALATTLANAAPQPKPPAMFSQTDSQAKIPTMPNAATGTQPQLGETTKARSNRREQRNLYIVVAVAVVSLAGAFIIWKAATASPIDAPKPTNNNASTSEAPPKAERVLNYVIAVYPCNQKGEPTGDAIEMYREMDGAVYFKKDDCLRLKFTAPDRGYLYLLNEAPKPESDGRPIYHVLFPSSADNNSSAVIEANQTKQVPKENLIGFGGNVGTEKVWIIWSINPIPELEAVKTLNNPKNPEGTIKDAKQTDGVKKFLDEHLTTKPQVNSDETSKQIKLNFAGDMLAHKVELQHR